MMIGIVPMAAFIKKTFTMITRRYTNSIWNWPMLQRVIEADNLEMSMATLESDSKKTGQTFCTAA